MSKHPLDGLDALAPCTSGRDKIETFFPDEASQQRIIAAFKRGVSFVDIAEFLTSACGHEIGAKSVSGWIRKAQKRAA